MDYKEKYEQALAKAKEQYNYPCMRSCMGILEEIFPELAESEDEKVRKEIISHLQHEYVVKRHVSDVEYDKWLAWLGKQGEKKASYTTWKPSGEQIKVCKEVYADLLSAKGFDLGTVVSELNRLEEGLKKKGE